MALSRFHKVSLAVNVVLLGAVVLLWSEPGTLMLSLL